MKKKSCYERAGCDPQHGLSGSTEEPAKHQQGNNAGPQAAKKKSWKRYLTFLSKFQNKMKHKKPDIRAPNGFKQKKPKRGLLLSSPILEECSNLVHVIRRTTADCFAAAAAAASGADEDDLPYMQLDQLAPFMHPMETKNIVEKVQSDARKT